MLPATQIQDSNRDLDSTFGLHLSNYHVSATWEAWPGTWTALFLGSSYSGSSGRPPCFPQSAFIWNGKGQKDQGTVACNNPEQEDSGVKHGSTLDTATNLFVQPHILLPTPTLLTLACNHLFSPLLALGTGCLAHGQP